MDLEKMQIQSCCASAPYKIDQIWLKQNPGCLFNIPDLVQDRANMLQDIPVTSCESVCWAPEKQGIGSRRISMRTDLRSHTNVISSPETINVILGNDCNLTCNYCCKHYSSAWANDVKFQNYMVETSDDRFRSNPKDIILRNLSQKDTIKSQKRQLLLEETQQLINDNDVSDIKITGGEPFLYNKLSDIVNHTLCNRRATIWSGLGLSPSRLKKELAKFKNTKNLRIVISAENTGDFYQYNRYGNTWDRFQTNVMLLEDAGLEIEFHMVITNFTVHDLGNFLEWGKAHPMHWSSCTDPVYLSPYVLDTDTRYRVLQQNLPPDLKDYLESVFAVPCTEKHRTQSRDYTTEFARRRNLDLDIFPNSFINWLRS